MFGRSVALVALALLVACAPDPPTSTTGATFPTAPPAPARHGGGAIDAFDAKLFGAFASHHGNFVYSPTSVALALAMTRRGARGATAAEMDAVLGSTAGTEAHALVVALGSSVAFASGLFVDARAELEPSFVDAASRSFGARVEAVDFGHDPTAARQRINGWIAERTNDRVRDLLGPELVRKDSRLVVVDALHFQATWLIPFPRPATKRDVFHLADGATASVDTMHGQVTGAIGEHGGARVLDLPYAPTGSRVPLSLTILIPNDPRGLGALEARYRREGLRPFAEAATRSRRIDVALPRFSVTSSADLASALESLGMRRPFTPRADFSGISRTIPLALSAFVHRATVEVDERGTEASAASTGGVVEVTSARIDEPLSFRVDRPFLFFVRDRATGTILFSGRLNDPR